MKKTPYKTQEEHQKPSLDWGNGKFKPQDYWGDKCYCPYHDFKDGKCTQCGGKA